MKNLPRPEYPRPDLVRPEWMNLNGEWDFAIDKKGETPDGEFLAGRGFDRKILVPFCPESCLSGIGEKDFMKKVAYKKELSLPAAWQGKRLLLHIGASDYRTTVYLNGKALGTHEGGYTPFTVEMTAAYDFSGKNDLVIVAEDDILSCKQVSGKQSHRLESFGCSYTRTTGIWQSVWAEPVAPCYVKSYFATSDLSAPAVTLTVRCEGSAAGKTLTAVAKYEGRVVGKASTRVAGKTDVLTVPLSEKHLWEAGAGRLYDLELSLSDGGEVLDAAQGYFGLRTVRLDPDGFRLNGEKLYLRFVLDQGFYPDGIYTARDEDALIFDVEASMKLGFNGARLHQKVFEPRFLYQADKHGYLLFGEAGNWGLDHTDTESIYHFLPEWIEEVERDRSHPSIIGWCPFNETWDQEGRRQYDPLIDTVYLSTHAMDPSRPVIANSGSFPTAKNLNDANDIHDYEQDPEKLRAVFADCKSGVIRDQIWRKDNERQKFDPARPTFFSEYGGIGWSIGADGWGYGKSVKTEEEFFERLSGLTNVLLNTDGVFGFCYTQLTDVEQEQNGLLTYERKFKFPPEKVHPVFSAKAKIEE